MQGFKDSLAFRGRLGRLGYWRWQMVFVLLSATVVYAAVAVAMAGAPRWLAILVAAPFVLLLVAALGVVARRLHDRGKGAGWLVLFVLVPWGLGALAIGLGTPPFAIDPALRDGLMLAASLGSVVLNLWGFVEIGLLRGKPGANRFGPAPL